MTVVDYNSMNKIKIHEYTLNNKQGAGEALPYSATSRITNVKGKVRQENNFAIVTVHSGKNF